MTRLELVGWLIFGTVGAGAVLGFGALACFLLRWQIYAVIYYATRALALRAERLHHWACRLPKEPPPPEKGGLYRGPVKLGDVREAGWAAPSGPTYEEAARAIRQLFKRAGLSKEIDHPTD